MSSTQTTFIGERLTEARVARGLSGVDLSDMVNVSPQSISKYENGHGSPRLEVLFKIAGVLRFPHAFFSRPKINENSNPVFWRGKLSAPIKMRDRARVRLDWLKEIVDYLYQYFDFPELDLIQRDPNNIESIDDDYLDGVASDLRAEWNVRHGPISNVIEKLENSGILVSRIFVHQEKLDAFSQWSDEFRVPFIVLGRDKSSAVRQRFDAVHELSHMVLHRSVKQKQLNQSSLYKLLESQADKLASRILLPEKDFVDELYAPTLDGFLSMKERWGVSVAAMIMKCKELGILSEDETKRMWINYSRRGWRKNEPLDTLLPKEEPLMVKNCFLTLIEEGVQTVADILSALPFPASEIEELADLEPGFLDSGLEGRSKPTLKQSSGNVIQFGKK